MTVAFPDPDIETPDVDLAAFEAAAVDPDAFDHAAHVYVAWLYLRRMSLHDAIGRYTRALRQLTDRLGVRDKYHETITWFFLITVAERMAADDAPDWPAFAARHPDLVAGGMPFVARRYSRERLGSSLARRQFVLPDRAPT